MTEDPSTLKTYPPGVPCLIDIEHRDPDAAAEFYGGLFGWTFENQLPPGVDDAYLVASLGGSDVAAIASPTPGLPVASWNTYVCIADADATIARAAAHGAEVVVAPVDAGRPGAVAGRWAAIVDPDGAPLRLWQPGYRPGAQVVNAPSSWNFSNLATPDGERALAFYAALFGWEAQPADFGDGDWFMLRRPGYGDFLAVGDPEIRQRHAAPGVPEGFSDAIGWMLATGDDPGSEPAPSGPSATWTVTFAVDGTDAAVDRAVRLGGTVVSPATDQGGGIVRVATLRDPQGGEFVVSTYDPDAHGG